METQLPVERTLTQIDCARLKRLSHSEPGASGLIDELIESSDLVASTAVPATVVTMYTQILLKDLTDATLHKLTLCYPSDAEPARGFISVLSPLGSSLLGLRVGAVTRWRTPMGQERSGRIVQVLFQPEASGDYLT